MVKPNLIKIESSSSVGLSKSRNENLYLNKLFFNINILTFYAKIKLSDFFFMKWRSTHVHLLF